METGGLWMLLAVAVLLLATGLPAYAVLMGVSSLFALAGAMLDGPAIVEQFDSTIVVPDGWQAHVDGFMNLILTRELQNGA